MAEPPKGLQRYEVSFYAKLPDERLVYVVFYEYDPTTDHGYIYLPGRADESYRLNVSTIYHGVEGRWFRAWSAWERVVRPLLAGLSCVNLGFNPMNVLTLHVPLSGERYKEPQARVQFWEHVVSAVESLPGVESASVSRGLPMNGWAGQFFTISEDPNPPAG